MTNKTFIKIILNISIIEWKIKLFVEIATKLISRCKSKKKFKFVEEVICRKFTSADLTKLTNMRIIIIFKFKKAQLFRNINIQYFNSSKLIIKEKWNVLTAMCGSAFM